MICMGETIKTRYVKKDIKMLDKSVSISEKVRRGTERIKDTGEQNENDTSPTGYAEGQVEGATRYVGIKTLEQGKVQSKKLIQKIKLKEPIADNIIFSDDGAKTEGTGKNSDMENAIGRKEAEKQAVEKKQKSTAYERGQSREQARKRITESSTDTKNVAEKGNHNALKLVKTREPNRSSIQKTAKGAVKQKKVIVKSSGIANKVKTSNQTAIASKRAAAKAAKEAKRAVQATKQAQKEIRKGLKITAKLFLRAIKRMAFLTKELIALLIGGGSTAVIIILVVALIGFLICSPFGIFFSGDSGNSKSEQSMSKVIEEINKEYQDKIDKIKKDMPHDVLEVSGAKASWNEVLAVYAVKTNMDATAPQEVATITAEKKELLRTIFWEMNQITSKTEKKKVTVTEESDDGNGNVKQIKKKVTKTYLYIKVTHKSATEMSQIYGFNDEKMKSLTELLAEKNASLWASVLYGITTSVGDKNIVDVAKSQIGNVGGKPYWSWYGFQNRVAWCACFVSWCANECGYLESGVIPRFSLCTDGVSWFKSHGQWQNGEYTPATGDIIFFDWDGDGKSDHVGIVESVKNNVVYTVEGNSSDCCKQNSYRIGKSSILGYGVPAY